MLPYGHIKGTKMKTTEKLDRQHLRTLLGDLYAEPY